MPPRYAMKQTINDIHLLTLSKKKDSKKKATEQVLRKRCDSKWIDGHFWQVNRQMEMPDFTE